MSLLTGEYTARGAACEGISRRPAAGREAVRGGYRTVADAVRCPWACGSGAPPEDSSWADSAPAPSCPRPFGPIQRYTHGRRKYAGTDSRKVRKKNVG